MQKSFLYSAVACIFWSEHLQAVCDLWHTFCSRLEAHDTCRRPLQYTPALHSMIRKIRPFGISLFLSHSYLCIVTGGDRKVLRRSSSLFLLSLTSLLSSSSKFGISGWVLVNGLLTKLQNTSLWFGFDSQVFLEFTLGFIEYEFKFFIFVRLLFLESPGKLALKLPFFLFKVL